MRRALRGARDREAGGDWHADLPLSLSAARLRRGPPGAGASRGPNVVAAMRKVQELAHKGNAAASAGNGSYLAAVSTAFAALALALAAAAAAAATANVAAAAHAFWQRADVPLVLRRAILPDAQHQLAATHRQTIKQPGAEAGEKQLGLFRGLCAGCDSVLFAHAAACRPALHSETSITAKVQLRKPRGNDIEQGRFGAVRARGCRLAGGILWAAG